MARVINQRRVAANHVRLLSSGWVVTTHDGTAGGSTGRGWRVGMPELHALGGKRIDVGCLHRSRLIDVITTDILPTEIIGENKNHIRFGRALGSVKKRGERQN